MYYATIVVKIPVHAKKKLPEGFVEQVGEQIAKQAVNYCKEIPDEQETGVKILRNKVSWHWE